MTSTITEFLSADHRKCDAAFLQAETLTAEGRWPEAAERFQHFRHELEHHLAIEELVLFPAFESATGNTGGPTEVMRDEHERMRSLLDELAVALQEKDQDACAGHAETLNILIQQHNIKEENILYRMADRMLDAAALIPSMRELALAEKA